jgi:hypothetical protein
MLSRRATPPARPWAWAQYGRVYLHNRGVRAAASGFESDFWRSTWIGRIGSATAGRTLGLADWTSALGVCEALVADANGGIIIRVGHDAEAESGG